MYAASNDPALFPGRSGNATQTDLKRFWASICKAAEVSGVRVNNGDALATDHRDIR